MLIRIVKMTFQEERLEDFVALFKDSQPKIEAMPGCQQVTLMQDWEDPQVYITYSHWDNKKALDHYRHSEMFKDVWARTKAMFADKPQAFSMKAAII